MSLLFRTAPIAARTTALRSSYSSVAGTAASVGSSAAGQVAKSTASEAATAARSTASEATTAARAHAKEAKADVKSAAASVTPSAPIVVGRPTVRRPVASVRGGLLGFLLGFGLASAYGYYYLLKEYNAASNLMLASVEELQGSTEKITSHLARLNKLEADIKALSNSSVTRADADKSRVEIKKIVDGLHSEVEDIRKRVIDLPRPTKYMQ
ncbi:uncharacterized protein PFL1_06319 [Pseudozyma flocculosa PF-1]|uniref:Uncharacterized protein n=2 Tax=Pseudozyma flocculosa TaxID=84751 RepID=A0A5C3F8G7_9BASI|nr:uncharacterized protein PFL1_06319 [Pseudozyma flocculosa PF-1]EPQ26111.1 hypothetical protein PFL1_06319 [Pseudozyma flocculosa PF-1]SPO40356.1 uncharacterized protein PSFLO_05838 [Pseudozyma flocculosa]